MFSKICFIPTIAGISCVLAIIAICEFTPPISVIIPATFFKFNLAVSDVASSFATNMVFCGKFDKSTSCNFNNFDNILFFISSMSLLLADMYGSSISSNVFIILFSPISTAYELLHFSCSIILIVSSIRLGSCNIIKYACIISFSVPEMF